MCIFCTLPRYQEAMGTGVRRRGGITGLSVPKPYQRENCARWLMVLFKHELSHLPRKMAFRSFRRRTRRPHLICSVCVTQASDMCEYVNTFTAVVDLSRFNNSCLKSPSSTLVDLTFQSRALRSFSLNKLRNLSL